jgi:hypothetical protein
MAIVFVKIVDKMEQSLDESSLPQVHRINSLQTLNRNSKSFNLEEELVKQS